MGRLSEDIMAIFGVKPLDRQSFARDPPAVSTAPDGTCNCVISYDIIMPI